MKHKLMPCMMEKDNEKSYPGFGIILIILEGRLVILSLVSATAYLFQQLFYI